MEFMTACSSLFIGGIPAIIVLVGLTLVALALVDGSLLSELTRLPVDIVTRHCRATWLRVKRLQ